ncbi:MAG: methylamine dehydrogenase (amicyanin) small subunit [Geminicoccaceae bacterium]|nr:methylamine dehydrogenase (amicyanin) small subunit [Geminicoccaceae bacterium]
MFRRTLFDQLFEAFTRRIASRSSRRSFIGRVGAASIGAGILPLLPVDRRGGAKAAGLEGWKPQARDPMSCDYWRHCSLDGYLCLCAGGGLTSCPPGTAISPSSWVASCHNPEDGQSYLIAYRDCCGKNIARRCGCFNTVGELPIYRPEFSNDIIWCFGAEDEAMTYHCTISPVIGRAA